MWSFTARSVTGTSHTARGVACQDACRAGVMKNLSGPSLMAVVADGAGSASRSQEGAVLACRVVMKAMAGHVGARCHLGEGAEDAAVGWFAEAHTALDELAVRERCAARDFACTLLFALVNDDGAVFGHVGDGAVVVGRGNDEGQLSFESVTCPTSGEYVNTTFFITGTDYAERMQCVGIDGRIDAVALMSDGLQDLAVSRATNQPHAGFFSPLVTDVRRHGHHPRALGRGVEAFLASPRINARTDDDKTLVLGVRRNATTGGTGGAKS